MSKYPLVELGDVGDSFIGLTYKPENISNNGIIVLRSGNIQNNKIDISTDIVKVDKDIKEKLLIQENDILICSRNGSAELVGKSALINEISQTMTFGAFMMVYRCKYNKYISHFFISPYFKRQLNNSKTTTINQITKKMLDSITISLPPLNVQKHIADTLDTTSDLINLHKQSIIELDNLIQSTFIDMFGDPVANDMGWEVKKIKETVINEKNALKAGPFGSSLKKEFYVEKGYRVYGQEEVIRNNLNYGNYYIDEERYNKLKSCSIKYNDVLISLVGTYGKLLIVPKEFEKGIINPRLMKISFDTQIINTIFFKFFFQSKELRNYLTNLTHGGTMPILNLGIVKDVPIPIPPLDLQEKFADIVSAIEEQKSISQQALDDATMLYNRLLQDFFE